MASLRMEENRATLLMTPLRTRKDGVSHRDLLVRGIGKASIWQHHLAPLGQPEVLQSTQALCSRCDHELLCPCFWIHEDKAMSGPRRGAGKEDRWLVKFSQWTAHCCTAVPEPWGRWEQLESAVAAPPSVNHIFIRLLRTDVISTLMSSSTSSTSGSS
ncbi:uncharacterized protein LOC107400709 isoform X2 [Peromyscus maniculatus bairdii]|uniref:uncharacterized protein LOC107400709 isoform X2 n=1 Tax=Peromyscus maniculatus bairdii TaxID=230844 RepID=UPI003FCFD687